MDKVKLTRRTAPPMSDKFRRLLWAVVWLLFCRFSPVPFHGWRCFILRLFGAKVGRKTRVYPAAVIWAPWNITLGEHVTIGGGARLYSVDKIQLGDHVIISQRAYICTATHDYNQAGFDLSTAPIEMQAHAWVSAEAFVGPGVIIGQGGVALARAVVVKSVEAYKVVGGNPAKVIAERNLSAINHL